MATEMLETNDPGGAIEPVFEVAGNQLTLLSEGRQAFDMLIALIDGAQKSLRLLYYMYSEDEAGKRVRSALLAAVGRGVRVSLIIDGFGSGAGDAFFAPLEAVGADVCRFIPRFGRRYLLRNHQKLALADEQRVIIGGFNIEDDYFGDPARGAWRDLGALIEGPAATRLVGYYDALARWSHRPKPRMRDLRRALNKWSEPEGAVRWLFGGPTRRLNPWARAVKNDMQKARRVAMIAAYFAPSPAMLRRLEAVARRGSTRIITPARSDSNAMIAAARHCYARLLRRGVEIHEYQLTKLHTKLFIAEDAVHLGSANFDMRSLFLNLELMLRIDDPVFADHCRRYFEGELARSRQITREAHHAASNWLRRLQWGLAYFVVAVLDNRLTRRLNFGMERRVRSSNPSRPNKAGRGGY
jgi:cardiolipin synthase A/B